MIRYVASPWKSAWGLMIRDFRKLERKAQPTANTIRGDAVGPEAMAVERAKPSSTAPGCGGRIRSGEMLDRPAWARDEHHGQPGSARRVTRPKTKAQQRFCALGPEREGLWWVRVPPAAPGDVWLSCSSAPWRCTRCWVNTWCRSPLAFDSTDF